MKIDIIKKLQQGDSDATLFLIDKFNPLIIKYSRKLSYEDAYNDLLLDFLEALHNMKIECLRNQSDASVVSYIVTSVHNSYVKRLVQIKKSKAILLYSELSEQELSNIESACSTIDKYSEINFSAFKKILTTSEFSIIVSIYFMGHTAMETARLHGVSRQAVNQTRLRALKKLEFYTGQA